MADNTELLQSFYEAVHSVLHCIRNDDSVQDMDEMENILSVCETLFGFAITMEDRFHGSDIIISLANLVQSIQCFIEQSLHSICPGRGRPKVSIEEGRLRYLVENGFKIRDIAEMFGCSESTVERRFHDLNISLRNYTTLVDNDLDLLIGQLINNNPKCGEKSVTGRLRSSGIIVQRERVRESLRRVNPTAVVTRFRIALHRRIYSVPSPNAM